jgi:hypothetical protein
MTNSLKSFFINGRNLFTLMLLLLSTILSAPNAIGQACQSLGGSDPTFVIQNFDGLGLSAAPANSQVGTNIFNLSVLTPNNPPASRFLGRFDNTINDAGGTVNVPWAVVEEGGASTTVSGRYGVNNGGTNDGNTYSYGATGATDRALGSLTNGVLTRTLIGACFTNATGAPVNNVYIYFTGEQWRVNPNLLSIDRLDFQYAVDVSSTANIFTANNSDPSDDEGEFTDFDPLDFVSPVPTSLLAQQLDGNFFANRRITPTTIIPVTVPAGSTIYIRWVDSRAGLGGNDNALAIDDVRVGFTPPTAAGVAVGGRVTNAFGRGIFGATVTATDSGGNSFYARTNFFGYYNFSEITVGQTYLFEIKAKRYSFNPTAEFITQSREDLNFTALP